MEFGDSMTESERDRRIPSVRASRGAAGDSRGNR